MKKILNEINLNYLQGYIDDMLWAIKMERNNIKLAKKNKNEKAEWMQYWMMRTNISNLKFLRTAIQQPIFSFKYKKSKGYELY